MGSPKLANLIGVYAGEIQELEDVFYDISRLRDPTAPKTVGMHLDNIGTLIGCPREDDTDARYKVRLQAQSLVNASNGTVPEIVAIVQLLAPGISFTLNRGFIAEYDVYLNEVVTEKVGAQVKRAVEQATAGGVKVFVSYHTSEPYFGFLESVEIIGSWLESATPGLPSY